MNITSTPSASEISAIVLSAREVSKQFARGKKEAVRALDGVSFSVARGQLTALVGPDGAGKTTLIRLACGLMTADSGEMRVLGVDVAADPQQVQSRVAYMPQRFGLYEDLTVQENLDLYANMHGVSDEHRREVFPALMKMTALEPFTRRLAGQLSGGMKQKLGLACTLIRRPELLLLDEPTVGVDPLSRRELWDIIFQLVGEGLTVFISTSYLDEADRCARVIVLNEGRVLADGQPADIRQRARGRSYIAQPPAGMAGRQLQAKILGDPHIIDAVPQGGQVRLVTDEAGDPRAHVAALADVNVEPVEPSFEDGFMILLGRGRHAAAEPEGPPALHAPAAGRGPAVNVHGLTRRFGDFTAVDHVTFQVREGEVFGLLGPNGAGKTTTFRMLCGLLPASGGTLTVAGVTVRHARASARQRLGYVAQKFSLYGQLSVRENLHFFASSYGLAGSRRRQRVDWALGEFDLGQFDSLLGGQLPGGYRQRLAMAAALMHEPDILFLDEPTSGADPQARRDFWRRITALAQRRVTVIVTTHFMEEAEYCDRAVIMDAGKVLAEGTPAEIRSRAKGGDMEEAFIAIVEESRRAAGGAA